MLKEPPLVIGGFVFSKEDLIYPGPGRAYAYALDKDNPMPAYYEVICGFEGGFKYPKNVAKCALSVIIIRGRGLFYCNGISQSYYPGTPFEIKKGERCGFAWVDINTTCKITYKKNPVAPRIVAAFFS